ncbi:hypothetical protein [Spirosoma pulveris]
MVTKSLLCILLLTCGTLTVGQTRKQSTNGGDKDAHGCIRSAGYTFSVLKNDCIRVFEQTIQLKEVSPTGSFTSNATVIFSKDTKQAEVFIPGSATGVLLARSSKEGKFFWKKGNLTLLRLKGYVLKRGNQVIFSGG